MKKLFETLSVEEAQAPVSLEANILDDLAVEEAQDELTALSVEVAADVVAMNEAEAALVSVEELIVGNETALANPETVTGMSVVASQESLKHAMTAVGLDMEEEFGSAISHENASASPVNALELSTEGAKEFVKKVIDGIKMIVKKIGVAIKKMVAKIVVILDGTAKNAGKLKVKLESAGKDKPVEDKFSEGEVKSLRAKFGTFAVASGAGEINIGLVNNMIDLNNNNNAVIDITKANKETITVLKEAFEKSIDNGGALDDAALGELGKKLEEITSKSFAGVKGIGVYQNIMKQMQTDAKDILKGKGLSDAAMGDAIFVPYRYDATVVKAFYVTLEKEKLDKAVADKDFGAAVAQLKLGDAQANAGKSKDGLKAEAVPSKGEIVSTLDKLMKEAGKVKESSKISLNSVDGMNKIMDGFAKVAEGVTTISGGQSAAFNKATAVAKLAITNMTVESILGQVAANKAALQYCAMATKKFTGRAKKEKKEDK
jgi:hypothetical protein